MTTSPGPRDMRVVHDTLRHPFGCAALRLHGTTTP
jgi:hypothetical protein